MFFKVLQMATIPYPFPQEQWPTISYFRRRYPENMYAHSADVSLVVLSPLEQFFQRYFAVFLTLAVIFYNFWPNFLTTGFAMLLWCQELFFISFCCFYFLLCLFVLGYPFGCHVLTGCSFLFPHFSASPLVGWFASMLGISFALESNFSCKVFYDFAIRTKAICNLCFYCFFDIAFFVCRNLLGYSVPFYSHNFLTLRRLLTSVVQTSCATHKIRRHPNNRGHFNRHVRITRQMRFQLVRFLRTYEMHFADLVDFLDQNKEHFTLLEQIYFNGAETPMST